MEDPQIMIALPSDIKGVVHEQMERRLSEGGCRLRSSYSKQPLDESVMCKEIRDVAGLIVALEPVSARVIDAARSLKVISKFGIGTDNIDIGAAERHGVVVTNCPGSNSNAVAELTLGLMISLLRDVQNQCNDLRAGRWNSGVGSELAGKNIGIIGFGNIGRAVARYLAPFGTRIRVYDSFHDRHAEAEYGFDYACLEELLAKSEIITVHLPLTPATRHILNGTTLAMVKPGAVLINVARGGVVDEQALLQAVEEGRIRRVAVDVFEHEPPTASRLLADDRFLVLPHIGGVTVEAMKNVADMAIDNVLEVLAGREASHRVRSESA